jgi:hypothetical protein
MKKQHLLLILLASTFLQSSVYGVGANQNGAQNEIGVQPNRPRMRARATFELVTLSHDNRSAQIRRKTPGEVDRIEDVVFRDFARQGVYNVNWNVDTKTLHPHRAKAEELANIGTAQERIRGLFLFQDRWENCDLLDPRQIQVRGEWSFVEDKRLHIDIYKLVLKSILNLRDEINYIHPIEREFDHDLIKVGPKTLLNENLFENGRVTRGIKGDVVYKSPRPGSTDYLITVVNYNQPILNHEGKEIVYVKPFDLLDSNKKIMVGKYTYIRNLEGQELLKDLEMGRLLYSDGKSLFIPHVTQELWKQGDVEAGFCVASISDYLAVHMLPEARVPGGFLPKGLYHLAAVNEEEEERQEKWVPISHPGAAVLIKTPKGLSSIAGLGKKAPFQREWIGQTLLSDSPATLNEGISRYLRIEAAQKLITYCQNVIDGHKGSSAALRLFFGDLANRLLKLETIEPNTPLEFNNILKAAIGLPDLDGMVSRLLELGANGQEVSFQIKTWVKSLDNTIKSIRALSQVPAISFENETLTLQGMFLSTTDVLGAFQQYPTTTHINVFGLNTFFFGQDLKLPGVSISVFAPHWRIPQATRLDLSGRDGQEGVKGADGANGPVFSQRFAYEVNLIEGGVGVGLLLEDRSNWISYKEYTTPGLIRDFLEVPCGYASDKVIVVFYKYSPQGTISKFNIHPARHFFLNKEKTLVLNSFSKVAPGCAMNSLDGVISVISDRSNNGYQLESSPICVHTGMFGEAGSNGEKGKVGSSGENGGYFLGKVFPPGSDSLKNLTLLSHGGNGGKGGDGGKGGSGSDGRRGFKGSTGQAGLPGKDGADAPFLATTERTELVLKNKNISEIVNHHLIIDRKGENGEKGQTGLPGGTGGTGGDGGNAGNGEMGGAGGKAGLPGSCLINSQPALHWVSMEEGKAGKSGENGSGGSRGSAGKKGPGGKGGDGGSGGPGGRDGRKAIGHSILQKFINFMKPQTSCNQYLKPPVLPHHLPSTTFGPIGDTGPKGQDGAEGSEGQPGIPGEGLNLEGLFHTHASMQVERDENAYANFYYQAAKDKLLSPFVEIMPHMKAPGLVQPLSNDGGFEFDSLFLKLQSYKSVTVSVSHSKTKTFFKGEFELPEGYGLRWNQKGLVMLPNCPLLHIQDNTNGVHVQFSSSPDKLVLTKCLGLKFVEVDTKQLIVYPGQLEEVNELKIWSPKFTNLGTLKTITLSYHGLVFENEGHILSSNPLHFRFDGTTINNSGLLKVPSLKGNKVRLNDLHFNYDSLCICVESLNAVILGYANHKEGRFVPNQYFDLPTGYGLKWVKGKFVPTPGAGFIEVNDNDHNIHALIEKSNDSIIVRRAEGIDTLGLRTVMTVRYPGQYHQLPIFAVEAPTFVNAGTLKVRSFSFKGSEIDNMGHILSPLHVSLLQEGTQINNRNLIKISGIQGVNYQLNHTEQGRQENFTDN